MKRLVLGALSVLALFLTLAVPALAQERIAVCIQGFEGTPGVQYLTEAQIAELEEAVPDPNESTLATFIGYPDPATGSCATENGELMEYDPAIHTPICVPSGPEGDGPLVVQFGINHYLQGYTDVINVIYADPVTGSCAEGDTSESAPGGDASAQDPETYNLLIVARNCDSELVEFFLHPQEGCVPAGGAFFNVTSDSGEFLGNCEAEANETPIFAGCTVEVPYGSTGFVTEDLASLPEGYVPRENPVPFYAEFADGEDYPPIFINVLQGGTSPTTGLPNTGTGIITDNNQSTLMTILGFASASALLFGIGLRTARRPV